jgi:NifU-like protein involved in Fe-S cluster formation
MLDSVGEGIRFCGGHPADYMHVYISVKNERVDDIKYLCNCDPAANVVVEVLCGLVKGRTLEEVSKTTEEEFYGAVGSRSEEMRKKTRGILELLGRGLSRYRAGAEAGFTT